jgi:hypothetical protein
MENKRALSSSLSLGERARACNMYIDEARRRELGARAKTRSSRTMKKYRPKRQPGLFYVLFIPSSCTLQSLKRGSRREKFAES